MLITAHKHCSDCGSSDAMSHYKDDTNLEYTYCFSCHKKVNIGKSLFSIFPNQNKSKLCTQISDNFPKEALSYLLKYRIFQSDIISSGIKYDNKASRILFPMAANGSYQGRSLDKNQIKYMTYGDKNYKLFGDDNVVVLCEDWLSSYRVSQQPGVSAVCLFGTSCSNGSLLKLVSHKCKLILWLDGDKPGQDAAKKITKSLALYYPSIYNVTTPQDPKTYSDNEIRSILYERIGYYEGSTQER